MFSKNIDIGASPILPVQDCIRKKVLSDRSISRTFGFEPNNEGAIPSRPN